MNPNESIVAQSLEKKGFRIFSRGWPDFLCVKRNWNGRIWEDGLRGAMAVEVKAGKDQLSDSQRAVHAVLKSIGLPVYVIRADLSKNLSLKTTTFLTTEEMLRATDKVRQLERELEGLKRTLSEATSLIEPVEYSFTSNPPVSESEA